MQNLWINNFAKRAKHMESSVIRELLKTTNIPGVISFAGGYPAPEVFPVERIRQACEKVLTEAGDQALQYSMTEGYPPLREMICKRSARYGIKISPENVLITNGSQQALDLIGKLFIDPGDKLLVESPTYLGALQAWRVYGAEFVSVDTDEDGMVPESLASLMDVNPKLLYLLPNFQNPMGSTLSADRRQKILEIAHQYQVPIIEDDPYGQLRFDGEHIPPVVSYDANLRGNDNEDYQGNVIYLSTFSKILAPGFRLAWVIAPKEIIRKLVLAKQGTDLHTSTFSQMVVNEVCKDNFLDQHIPVIRDLYHKRRDLMMEMIDELFPAGVKYVRPKGGLFLWIKAPEEIDTQKIFPLAIDKKVAYVPGGPFHPNGGGQNTMRLNFSFASEDEIKAGIARLAEVLKTAMQ
ncbi:MAG: aminotransferase class I/II-fold pyridoxal phosphate-dependent enzyme [Gammaproteobacteria bacterium]|nr:aminotransferase class I/II-fold pyridoxal phosphate-dependent enzyme [Gammaproteobacteria bacterium]